MGWKYSLTKLFKTETEKWLDKHGVVGYTIDDDLTVDVEGSVNISEIKLREIPIQFGKVSGDFNCSGNILTTLKGCPKEVGGSFTCARNHLFSLEHGPKVIGADYYCDHNYLLNLKHIPYEIPGIIHYIVNKLEEQELYDMDKYQVIQYMNAIVMSERFARILPNRQEQNLFKQPSEQFKRTLTNPSHELKKERRLKL